MRAEISREFAFEAAHHLPTVGPDHKCFRLHGHLYRVEVTIGGEVDPVMGWVMDFAELAEVCRDVIRELDHRVLNDIPEIGVPTSENIATYLCERLRMRLPSLVELTVHESPTSRCTVRARPVEVRDNVVTEEAGPYVFSAAHFLLFPDGGREAIHGHDYLFRIRADFPRGHGGLGVVARCALRAIEGLNHRLLIPGRASVMKMDVSGDTVRMVLPAEVLCLSATDIAVIEVNNTTAEAIAHLLATRVASDPDMNAALRITATVIEGQEGSATASVDVRQ